MRRVAGNPLQRENRALAGLVHADLPRRADQLHRDQWLGKSLVVQQIECRRMESRCTQVFGKRSLGFDQGERNPAAAQQQCREESDRARSDDDHPIDIPA